MPSSRSAPDDLTRVLLVDDEVRNLEVLESILESPGLQLVRAQTPEEALLALVQGEFACLVLDVQMPGMSGFEMLEELRKDKAIPPVAVVMCSGSTYEDDLRRAENLGAAGYMVKPPSLDQLKPMLAVLPDLHLDQEGRDNRLMRAA